MARTKGVPNRGYDTRRQELADRLRTRLARAGETRPSFRDLAKAAGVGVTTLRHYFPDRDSLVREVMALHAPAGERRLAYFREPKGDFEHSVRDALGYLAMGLAQPAFAELHEVGLIEGLGRPDLGRAYLTFLLDPILEAAEARLGAHVESGEMRPGDLRAAALELVSPVLVAHLHQRALAGAQARPLDWANFLDAHAESFIRAHRADPA